MLKLKAVKNFTGFYIKKNLKAAKYMFSKLMSYIVRKI